MAGKWMQGTAVDVLIETTVNRGIAAPAWYVNTRSVVWETPRSPRCRERPFVAQFLGRRIVYTYEVVELVPPERLVKSTADGPFPMETTRGWEPSGDANRQTSWVRKVEHRTGVHAAARVKECRLICLPGVLSSRLCLRSS